LHNALSNDFPSRPLSGNTKPEMIKVPAIASQAFLETRHD
jgi:hypothetical protein